MVETETHDAVTENDRLLLPAIAVDGINQCGDVFLGQKLIDERKLDARFARQQITEQHATGCRLMHFDDLITFRIDRLKPTLYLGMQGHMPSGERMLNLRERAEHHTL